LRPLPPRRRRRCRHPRGRRHRPSRRRSRANAAPSPAGDGGAAAIERRRHAADVGGHSAAIVTTIQAGGGAMNSFETIAVESRDGVATITLNRPNVFNALNEALLLELRTALDSAHSDDSVGAVVVAGTGKAFSA